MNSKIIKQIGLLITVVSFIASFFILAGFFKNQGIDGIVSGFSTIAPFKIILSLIFSALSYFFLIFYDYLAARYIGIKLSFKKAASVSFTANAFGNSLGLSLLSSSAVRFRLYSLWQIPASKTAQIIVFCTLSSFTGFAVMSGILIDISVWPQNIPSSIKIAAMSSGIALAALLLLYIAWAAFTKNKFKSFGYEITPPGLKLTFAQVFVSVLEWFFAAAAFYALLPEDGLGFKLFIASYAAAELLGILSNVPGGLGVFDAAAVSLLSMEGSGSGAVISAVILYRIIYYLIPLIVSYFVYGTAEAEALGGQLMKKAGDIKKMLSSTPGYVFSFLVFVSGALVLLLISFPALQFRAASIENLIPDNVSFFVYILCAFSGAGLLMLARGLQKSVISSYIFSLILLLACSVFLIFTGLNYEISAVLLLISGLLFHYKGYFYRKTGPFTEKPTPGLFFTSLSVIAACFLAAWISNLLLSSETYNKNIISLSFAAVSLLIWFFIYIFRPYKPAPHASSEYAVNTALKIAFDSHDPMSLLALTGDKNIIFSWSGASFVMYAQCGGHWVALGDPYGPYIEAEEMIWKFKRLASQNKGTPVFFNVSSDYIHFYEDAGLNFYRIGDEAKVALEYYPFDMKNEEKIKKIQDKIQSMGYSFKVLPRGANAAFFKAAEELSLNWLKNNKITEPGFIMGIYNQNYLKRFHIAAVYKNEKLCAFTNILSLNNRAEFKMDLLKIANGCPAEMADYIRYKLILWGKEKHYAFFSIGIVPHGTPDFNSYFPAWNNAGAALYNYGLKFSNQQTLKNRMEIFSPIWHPRYLVCSNFISVPSIFSEIALLTVDKKK